MPPSNNEDIQAVRITEAGSFERISLDRNKVLDSLYRAIGCRYAEVIQVTEDDLHLGRRRGAHASAEADAELSRYSPCC